jgi:hypothetical protein
MQIQTNDSYTGEMDEIAEGNEAATFYHSRVWAESLSVTFPHMIFRCLVARRGRTGAGFFPFFLIRHGPLKTVWSMPFGTYGGPVAEDETCAAALRRAYGVVMSTAGLIHAGWIDFNNSAGEPGWDRKTADTHLVDLTGGFDRLWSDSIEKQRKKRTRRAENSGITVRRMNSHNDLRMYYDIYSRRLTGWGERTTYPLKLFEDLLERGGETVRLYVAEHDGKIVGGHFNFYSKNMVTAWNGVTTPESNHLQPGTKLYIECFKSACSEGFEVYNLGGSLGKQSLIDFKESLGGVRYTYDQYRRRSALGKLAAVIKGVGRLGRGR